MIEILIPTCLRPEVLDRTLDSFRRFLFTDPVLDIIPVGIHLNVDPVGPCPRPREVKETVQRHFPRLLSWRFADEPSFPVAFASLWQAASGHNPVFYLEDDWELLRPVDLAHMLAILEMNPDLAGLRLPWKPTEAARMKNWRYFFPWNGEFFACPADLRRAVGFCGHPGLFRGEFVARCAPHLDTTRNPEKQFHHGSPALMAEVDRWQFGVFARPNELPAIRDIGRAWMVEHGFRKAGSKAHFTHWENAPSPSSTPSIPSMSSISPSSPEVPHA